MSMSPKRKMMLALIIVALLVVIGFVVSSRLRSYGSAGSPGTSPDYAKLQGKWEFLSMEADGAPKPEAEYKKYAVVFKDDVWIVQDGTTVKAETKFELDAKADPKTIDLYPFDGRVLQGIYKLEGDRFTMCDRGTEKGDRPTRFATEPNSGLVLVTLRRVKP